MRAATGFRELEATVEGLHQASEYFDNWVKWPAVRSLSRTMTHVFIKLEGGQTYIIPVQKVTAGNLEDFVAAIHEKIASKPPLITD